MSKAGGSGVADFVSDLNRIADQTKLQLRTTQRISGVLAMHVTSQGMRIGLMRRRAVVVKVQSTQCAKGP